MDLSLVAAGAVVPVERPLLATRAGRFSLRWGSYVLTGARQRETRMCDLSLDSACIADVRATSPIALEAMRRWATTALTPAPSVTTPRAPALLDEHTMASLVRWGRPPPEGHGVSDER